MKITVFTDGGSRGNPGAAAIGVVVFDENGVELYQHSARIGVATNNEAEYEAFLHSIDWVVRFGVENVVTDILWQLDSKLVVEQLLKRWKIKEPRMRVFAEKAWESFDLLQCSYKISHVPREKNAIADALVNAALDAD